MVKVGGAADLPFASMHRLTLTADLGYRLSPDDVQALKCKCRGGICMDGASHVAWRLSLW